MAEDLTPKPKSNPVVRACVDYAGAAAFLVGYLVSHDVTKATWWLVVGSAAALIAALPPLVLALTIQRYLVRGLSFGAVKA